MLKSCFFLNGNHYFKKLFWIFENIKFSMEWCLHPGHTLRTSSNAEVFLSRVVFSQIFHHSMPCLGYYYCSKIRCTGSRWKILPVLAVCIYKIFIWRRHFPGTSNFWTFVDANGHFYFTVRCIAHHYRSHYMTSSPTFRSLRIGTCGSQTRNHTRPATFFIITDKSNYKYWLLSRTCPEKHTCQESIFNWFENRYFVQLLLFE